MATCITSFGHGTLGLDELAGLLVGAGIEAVVDIRRYPGSRRHPHLAAEPLGAHLRGAGLAYRWEPRLGGRRKGVDGSPNGGVQNAQLRAYADHMATPELLDAAAELVAEAGERSVAVMCSESVWWRCHRRLLADHLVLVAGVDVVHLMHDGRRTPHPPLPEATRVADHVEYPPPAPELPFDDG